MRNLIISVRENTEAAFFGVHDDTRVGLCGVVAVIGRLIKDFHLWRHESSASSEVAKRSRWLF